MKRVIFFAACAALCMIAFSSCKKINHPISGSTFACCNDSIAVFFHFLENGELEDTYISLFPPRVSANTFDIMNWQVEGNTITLKYNQHAVDSLKGTIYTTGIYYRAPKAYNDSIIFEDGDVFYATLPLCGCVIK